MSRVRHVFVVAAIVGALAPTVVAAQLCRGAAPEKRGWLTVSVGRAAEDASVFGADISWRFDNGLFVFGDWGRTAYPDPDPARDRLAFGVGSDGLNGEHFGMCPTVGLEYERIEDLDVQRFPIGVATGWRRSLTGVERHIGFTVEPFYVHQRAQIERFDTRRDYFSGRAGVVYGAQRLVTGLTFEHAFDGDARWNARARVGFTFQ